ncbi:MAG: acyl--CoA ligase [Thermus sp.]|uniref:class I adenylate-forming enzyme family protein n=1 Tax=Thermus sp. TaxID=275 RepID=UPI003328239F
MLELNPDWLGRLAQYHPYRKAVFFRGQWYTYQGLYERARQAAGVLQALGVGRQDRVGILANNHLAFLALYFSTPFLGHILTPFNIRLSLEELRALHAYTRPRVLFYGEGFETTAKALDRGALPLGALEGPPAVGEAKVGLEDPALLLFTGGTTGLPKGALIPYRQLLVNAIQTVMAWGLTREDRYIQATPMFHAALNVLTTPLLYLGGGVLIQERFDPEEYLNWVETQRVSLLFLVPTMFQTLSEHPRFAATSFSSVRFAISGGAPCPAPVREAFRRRGVGFKQGYGLTECGVNCFTFELDEAEAYPESVGRPMPHLEARLVKEDGQPAGPGEAGELWFKGPVVMLEYFERPEETAKVVVEEGKERWLKTGDLALKDEAGRFYIVGRKKEMYISGGENVFPVEVERALYEHPAVLECAVLGMPDPKWGEVGWAFVVLRPGARTDEEELRTLLKSRLAGYKIPKRFIFLDELPKSGPGKVLKEELRRRYG